MKRSTDRILTTHTGSLPRPMDLAAMLEALDSGEPPDRETFQTRVRAAEYRGTLLIGTGFPTQYLTP